MDSANSFRNHLVPPSRLNSFHSLKVARTAMVLPLLVISVLGRGIEARLCSVIQTTQLGFVLVYNTTICVTLRVLYQHIERLQHGNRYRTLRS
jgi:hypothetical protein